MSPLQSCKKLFICQSNHFRDWDLPAKKTCKLQQNLNCDKMEYFTNLTQMLSIFSFWQVLHDLHDIYGIYTIFSISFVICRLKTWIKQERKIYLFAGNPHNFATTFTKSWIPLDSWNLLFRTVVLFPSKPTATLLHSSLDRILPPPPPFLIALAQSSKSL